MTKDSAVLVHHSVWGTHWLNATTLQSAITDRRPTLNVAVARTPAETARLISDVEVVLTSFMEPSLLEEAPSLKWIQALSAGVDTLAIDFDRLRDREIVLTSAAGAHAQPAAEQVLGYMLVFERRFDRVFAEQRRGVWERFVGGELAEKTLGIVGLGAIGVRTAEVASSIGMTVIGTKRDPSTEIDAVDRIYRPDELATLLVESDYVLLSCPLTSETRGLIGKTELGIMKDEGVLINVARGEIVVEEALIDALQQRSIRGAALDVFEIEPLPANSPLWDLSNVLITPHNAGVSPNLPERLADVFVENYDAFSSENVDGMRNRVL